MAVYTLEEYAKLKKKKKNGIENAITLEENTRRKGFDPTKSTVGDIAPIMTTSKKEEKEEAGKLDFFQKGVFEDGYNFGDVTKTILGTVGDAGVGLAKGVASLGEGITDLGRYGVAGVADKLGNDNYADKVREKAKKNTVEDFFKDTDDYLNQYSVLGRTSDAVMQGLGQVGGILLTGGVAGALGAGALGATVATTGAMGLSSAGSGMSEAYQGGATDKEATMYGISKGIIDAGSELIFGGLGKAVNAVGLSKGISSLDDVFAQKLSSKISNQVAKNITEFGVKASAEGFEEVLAGLGSAVAKKLTYMEEEELSDLVKDENLLEQFVVGTVTSGMIQSGYIPKTAEGSLKEANETGKDFITGYTQNEQAVIDKEVEKRVGDQKLSKKELGKIEEEVKKDLEKGYIDIDTIESALGGETYNKYKSITEQEETLTKQLEELKNAPNTVGNAKLYEETENKLAELKKNSNKTQIKEQLSKEVQELTKSDLLIESYNEKGRRSQAFEADLTKYDEKQQAVIKKAVESGILNNTNKTHEFVDMVAKISADKGVLFDFTNNTKLKDTGFAIEGKTVNGYIKDGNIAVNIDSNKALNTVVGHEITHVLEGTDLYTELQSVVKEYATTKGEYQTRYDALAELYKDVEGAVIENEITADLVGEYLFTDSDFINSLSTTKPNVFKKIYDEIKYLYKLATAGSKEARELEKVKRAFDKAYKESKTAEADTKYSLEKTTDGTEYVKTEKDLFLKEDGTPLTEKEVFNSLINHEFVLPEGEVKIVNWLPGKSMYQELFRRRPSYNGVEDIKQLNSDVNYNMEELIDNSKMKESNVSDTDNKHSQQGIKSFDTRTVNFYDGNKAYTVDLSIATLDNGEKVAYAKKFFEFDEELTKKIQTSEAIGKSKLNQKSVSDDIIPQNKENATDTRYSLSSNSEGKTLTKEQQEYFKDSVVRDENGNLKVMYHGTSAGGHTVFDPFGKSKYGLFGAGTYFTDNKSVAESYTDKGKGDNKQIYETYLNITNPIDMDAQANPEAWKKAFPDADFPETGTNEEYFRAMEQVFRDEQYPRWEAMDTAMDVIESMGYDGITHIGGGRFNKSDDTRHQVYIAFQPEQIKNIDNANPTTDADIRYSLSDENINKVTDDGLTMTYVRVPNKNTPYYGSTFGQNIEPAGEYMSMDTLKGKNKIDGYEYGTIQFKKPLVLEHINTSDTGWKKTVSDMYKGLTGKKLSKALIKDGYDAIVTYDEYGYNEIVNLNGEKLNDGQYSLSDKQEIAPTGNYRVYGKDIALETPENAENITEIPKNSEKISETAPKTSEFEDYAPLTEEEANERDAMQGDRLYDLNDFDMPEEVEAPYYEETVEPTEVESPFEEKDIQEVGNRKQKAYMYENPEVKPYFQAEANVMLGELRNSVKGEKHFNDQLYYDTNGEQGWYGTKRETSEQIAYMLDKFKYTYADIEKGLKAIIEDHGAENNAVSKRLEFMLDERLREGYTDFASGYEIPSNQEYINLLNEKQITEYSDEAYNRYLESLALEEPAETLEAPVDEAQVLYSLEAQQQEKIAELDSVVEAEDSAESAELPTTESFDAKLENYKNALEGYKTAKTTIENAFDEAINKKTAEYEALKRKDTKRASDLLTQIENLKLRKSNNVLKIDSKIAKVETTIDKMSKGIPTKRQIYHRNIVDKIKNTFTSKGFDFDKVLDNAKSKATFSSNDNTPQRFIEKSLGYKAGQILNDLTINKVAQNESKAIKWLNSYTDKKAGLLAQISKEYGIKPRSKESASAQMYAEGFWVDDDGNFIKYGDEELAKDFPNVKVRENIKKLAKDERIRKIYDDTLKMINDSRTRNLYPEIPRRKNYFLHFREMDDTFSRLGIPFNPNDIRAKDLPTDINGMTTDLKPGQPYFASAKQRLGYKTTYDLVGGVERYLNSAKNQIYHIDDIQTLRALRNYIAERFGQAKGLENLDSLSEAEALERIEQVYDSHLSNFAKFLNEEANVLAGKTSLTDRGLEGVIGRRGIQFLDTVNRQVGSNMVGGNISSALTNTVSMVQAVAKANKFDATKAFAQTVSNQLGSIIGKTDGFVENSPMMIRRKGIERMTRTPWESITDKGYLLMGAIDNISSEFIVRTKFNELTRKGMSEQQAHFEADKWASRLLGDRSLGQQPLLYNSKMLGLVTKFQLEVRNQLDSMVYDTIQDAKVSNEEIENRLLRNMKTSAKVGSTFFQLAVLQHLFGKAFESVAGYNPAFDIVEALMQVFGFDDDEESEDTVLDNMEEGFLTLLGDLPYTSTFTGGRIPISSALPIKQFITGKDSYGNEKSRWETIKETAPYYLAPTGYGQIKKTIAGLEMFNEEHPVAGSYTKSGNLRFPIEDTPENRIRSAIFGQYASENARDYFDNERSPLKEKQIQEYKDLDIPIKDYWKYREGLTEHDKLEDKFDYIAGLDLPVEKKNIMINNIVDRKESVDMTNYDDFGNYEEFDFATKNAEKYEFLQNNNVSYEEYSKSKESREAYNWAYENPEKYTLSKVIADDVTVYRQYMGEINDIKADKDENGKTISGSRKEKVLNYINSLDADYYGKIILFKSEYKADDTYNEEIIDYLNNRNDITYEEEVEILKGLGFTVETDGTIRW